MKKKQNSFGQRQTCFGQKNLGLNGLGQKGFLGPIGDDLPSLIPLLFALMMFFYVFTSTWNMFDRENVIFNDALEALNVGSVLKGNNYLRGFETFEQRCLEAQSIRRINFMGGLLPLSTGPGQTFSGIDLETLETDFFLSDGDTFFCTNFKDGVVGDAVNNESRNLIIRSFPVALEFHNKTTNVFYVRPMLLVVVTWR